MEVKINKDINKFKGLMYFGLTLRQAICAAIAIVTCAVALVWLGPRIGDQAASWVCVLLALPTVALGFFTYNGMPFEYVAWAWLRDQVIEPRQLSVKFRNAYTPLLEQQYKQQKIDALKGENDGKEDVNESEDTAADEAAEIPGNTEPSEGTV